MSRQAYIIVNTVSEEILQSGYTLNAERALERELEEDREVILTDLLLLDTGQAYWDNTNRLVVPKSEIPEPTLSAPAPYLLDVSTFPDGSRIRIHNEWGDTVYTTKDDPPEFQEPGKYTVHVEPTGHRHQYATFEMDIT